MNYHSMLSTNTIFSGGMKILMTVTSSVKRAIWKGMGVLDRVEKLLNLKPEPLYTEKPGLKPIRECKLFFKYQPNVPEEYKDECFKYRPHVPEEYKDECCPPKPSDEVLQTEADQKKEKTAKYKKEKSAKFEKQDTATVDNSSNDHQELTTPAWNLKNSTSPTSPSKRKRDDEIQKHRKIFN
jgi:hypothetical protein